MFEALSERLESAWKSLRGQDKISESNINDALREVRRALLEADVNLQVIKDFIAQVKASALGAEVVKGISPDQQFIKIVNDELVNLMGETNEPLANVPEKPTVVLMAGLQGTGKTTATRQTGPAPAQGKPQHHAGGDRRVSSGGGGSVSHPGAANRCACV
jgi:signal recognition particle subunit SRP54